jgi:hypothetical protein
MSHEILLLQQTIDSFKPGLHQKASQNDLFCLKQLKLWQALEQTLQGQAFDPQKLAFLGYSKAFYQQKGKFSPFTFETPDLQRYIQLRNQIKQLRYAVYSDKLPQSTQELLNLLAEFESTTLNNAFDDYINRKLLTIKPTELATIRKALRSTLQTLTALTQQDIDTAQKQHIQTALNAKSTQIGADKYLSHNFIQSVTQTSSQMAAKCITFPQFQLLIDIEELLAKEQLNHRDLAKLKAKAKIFETAVLNLPSVNQITHYHWMLNIICNLLNMIYPFFESQKSIEIKQQFKLFNPQLNQSDKLVQQAEKAIFNII